MERHAASPNVKVLLAVRTVDLEEDARLRELVDSRQRIGRHTLVDLDQDAVRAHLLANGMDPPVSDVTMELLCTPLHLAVLCRLSELARYRVLDASGPLCVLHDGGAQQPGDPARASGLESDHRSDSRVHEQQRGPPLCLWECSVRSSSARSGLWCLRR